MTRRLIVASMIAVLGASLGASQQEFEFEVLPGEVDGLPLGSPVAIANDGVVLFQQVLDGSVRAAIYRRGQAERFDLVPQWSYHLWVTDINARGEIVGNNWQVGYPYGLYTGQGFRRNKNGTFQDPPSSGGGTMLRAINDRGVAVGEYYAPCVTGCPEGGVPEFPLPLWDRITPLVVVDGQATPLILPDTAPGELAGAVAVDDRGRLLVWRGYPARGYPSHRSYLLFDAAGGDLEPLDPPDAYAGLVVEFIDLNNRGQVLGTVADPAQPYTVISTFLRETSGAVRPIEWVRSWPESLVRRIGTGEELTVHLVRALGTTALGLNDSGEILVSTGAIYEGRSSNGWIYGHLEAVHGVARPRGSRRLGEGERALTPSEEDRR